MFKKNPIKEICNNATEKVLSTIFNKNTVLQITKSAAGKNIKFLDFGIREFDISAVRASEMPGYEDIYFNDEININCKTKITKEKGSLCTKEVNVKYEVIVPYDDDYNFVCTLLIFVSAFSEASIEDNTLKFYSFLIAKSIFSDKEFLLSVHPIGCAEGLKPFFPANITSLEKCGSAVYDVWLTEQSSNISRKEIFDRNARNEITLDEKLNIRNLHPEKKVKGKTFLISDFIRNIK